MKELPDGWQHALLGDLGVWRGGGTPSKSQASFWGGTIPWVSPKDMKTDLIVETEDHITSEAVARSSTQMVPAGSILVVTRSGILRRLFPVAVASRAVAINQDIKALTPYEGVEAEFVARQLRALSSSILSQCAKSGTTVDSVDFERLKNYQIALVPELEQRRIVAKLDSLFARTRRARAELSHIPRLIENYKKAILEAAFRGDLTRDWRSLSFARDPVFPRDADAIKKKYRGSSEMAFSPPYTMPNEWGWFRLPELGELDRGKSKHRPRNDRTLYGGDFPFVQTGEVREATRYLRYYSKTYNYKGLSQSRLWPVGTVCITIAANIAETAILDIDACFPDSVVGFIADKDRVSNSYVEFFLRTMKDDLEAFAPATAQKNINLDTLSSVYVPVPPLNEQMEIVNRIEKAMDWLKIVEEEQGHAMHLLDRLDQANLAKAFRGELVPQDPNDEPASVLLERICAARAEQPKNTRKGRGKTANARVAA
ncbi:MULTISPECIES: restriction endonuclease subunit S [unclassified Thiocapsa]|uniref:restriction endonuclease subunit S n=1 Tax=unclassified Thiocapsa TaxID=2641286 RepID=UPI0035AE33B3